MHDHFINFISLLGQSHILENAASLEHILISSLPANKTSLYMDAIFYALNSSSDKS